LSWQQALAVLEDEAARGWRDPDLTALFVSLVQSRPDALTTSLVCDDELGVSLFSQIRSTGALDWDHRAEPVTKRTQCRP